MCNINTSDSFMINVNVKYPVPCGKDNNPDEKPFEGVLGRIKLWDLMISDFDVLKF